MCALNNNNNKKLFHSINCMEFAIACHSTPFRSNKANGNKHTRDAFSFIVEISTIFDLEILNNG